MQCVAVVIPVMLTVLCEVEVALRVTVANQFRAPVKVVLCASSGGITAQRLSKDKNADWRPRDRVHSTVAHSSAQHQHRRKSG